MAYVLSLALKYYLERNEWIDLQNTESVNTSILANGCYLNPFKAIDSEKVFAKSFKSVGGHFKKNRDEISLIFHSFQFFLIQFLDVCLLSGFPVLGFLPLLSMNSHPFFEDFVPIINGRVCILTLLCESPDPSFG